MRLILSRLVFNGVLLIGAAQLLLTTGCNRNVPVVIYGGGGSWCPNDGALIGRLPTFCCNSAGTQINFSGDCSAEGTPTEPQVSGTLRAGAETLNASAVAIRTAASLVGAKLPAEVKTGGLAPQSAAATAGSIGSLSPETSGGSDTIGSQSPKGQFGQNMKFRTGGAGGFGASPPQSSPSNLSLEAGTATAANIPSQTDNRSPSKDSGADPGAVAKSSGPKGGTATQGPKYSLWLDGLTGDSATNGDADFSKQPGDRNPASSADPDDYFSRIRSSENLFKKVEHRYRVKSMDWALEFAKKKSR